jgi:hypothetical protein
MLYPEGNNTKSKTEKQDNTIKKEAFKLYIYKLPNLIKPRQIIPNERTRSRAE